jgi:TonB family protein
MDTATTPIKFDIYEGKQLVRTEILTENTIKIGKLSSSHVRIDDEQVSRMHAVIEVNGPQDVFILDLGSTTGTFVNGERVTKQRLSSNDRVELGSVTVVVTIAGQRKGGTAGQPARRAPVVNVPLFDEEESGDGQRALEILTLWGNTVVDVRHFTEAGSYTIGDADGVDHFAKPALLPDNPYVLAEMAGDAMVVNIPDTVDGEVMTKGRVDAIEDLRNGGKLGASAMTRSKGLSLPPGGRCRLKVGDITFLVNSVPAARSVGRAGLSAYLDPQFLRYLLSATVLHALFFLIVLSIPEAAGSLSLDGFDMDNRFVDFLIKPEEELQKELDDLMSGLKEEAQAAKDEKGKAGDENSQDTNKKLQVEGPVDQAEIELARDRAKQEAIDTAQTAFNQLEGQLSSVWGSSDRAIGSDAIGALGNLTGDKGGAAAGLGGLGLAGSGRGGGGFGESSIGVGNVGTKGRGGGSGGYGSGASRLGKRKSKVPKVVPLKPTVVGALDMETIRRVIRRHRNEYVYCYEKELNQKRDLAGKIKVKFIISGQGKVIAASVSESTMKNAKVENCLVRKVKRWRFPAPKGGGLVNVNYPFLFKAG